LLASLSIGVLLLVVYSPALHGPLLFDDHVLPFGQRQFSEAPLKAWISGVRPLLMITYWFNYQLSGTETFGYHVFNILLHLVNGILVFSLLRILAPGRDLLCGFCAALFLLHPLQTESVAYLAGRSELVVGFFSLSAVLVFLRHGSNEWSWVLLVTGLIGAAIFSKEQALALIPLLLFLESGWFENASRMRDVLRDRIRRDWRLWALLLAIGLAGAAMVWQVVRNSPSAGFAVAGRQPGAYFLTECRVVFQYLRLFFLPIGQNIDPHPPISHSIWQYGAAFWLGALVLTIAVSFRLRHRAPLATGGVLIFLILLAPTSSVIPLFDPMAEHRMYLPMIGLCLVLIDVLGRVRIRAGYAAAALICATALSATFIYTRSHV